MLLFSGPVVSVTRGRIRSRSFICDECKRAYVNSRDLKRHMRYECGKIPRFQCPYCPQIAKYRSTIYNHIRKRHPLYDIATVDLQM